VDGGGGPNAAKLTEAVFKGFGFYGLRLGRDISGFTSLAAVFRPVTL
jgi:hypothetical protein